LAHKALRLILVTALVIILLAPSLLPKSNGASITITVDSTSVFVKMNLELIENLTTSLPPLDVLLNQSNPVFLPLETGIQSIAHDGSIEQLTLHTRTALIDQTNNLWAFQENYTFTISGVTNNTGARVIADLSFLSTSISTSMIFNAVELNNVGGSYLAPSFQRFPPNSNTFYFAGSSEFTQPAIPLLSTSKFSFLDLSWIPPVSKWTGGYQALASSAKWDYIPQTPPYNVSVVLGQTPEKTFLKKYVAIVDPSVEVVAPAGALARGTAILFDLPTIAETAMPVIIGVSLITAITTFLLERTVAKPTRPVGRRRNRPGR